MNEWNNLDEKIKSVTSFSLFNASLLKMSCPHANSTYQIHNPMGIKLLALLRLGQVTSVNKNLDIILRIVWTHFASAVLNLRLYFTFFCTVLTSSALEENYLIKYNSTFESKWENFAHSTTFW